MIKTGNYKVFFEHLNLRGLIDKLVSSSGVKDSSLIMNSFRRVDEEERGGKILCGVTYCYLEDLEGSLINMGISRCSVEDRFNKETGRKISLKNAIKDLPRQERIEIWNAYHNRK